MAFRPTVFLAPGVLLGAGILVMLACATNDDEQRGNDGQLCFSDQDCDDPRLTCVLLPLEGGGNDGGECFCLGDACASSTVSSEDALTDGMAADSGEPADADGGGGDAGPESGEREASTEAASDAPNDTQGDSSGDELAPEASGDAKVD